MSLFSKKTKEIILSVPNAVLGSFPDIQITTLKSKRKTIAIHITDDCNILIKAPTFVSNSEIQSFINEKEKWILNTLNKTQSRKVNSLPKLSDEELNVLTIRAKDYVPQRVKYYASIMNVEYNKVTIRAQKTRWGSCSAKKNLNFNCLVMLTPIEVIDSIVVHELCHLKQMNHSSAFYDEIYKVYPEYDEWDKWLKKNGPEIINRIK